MTRNGHMPSKALEINLTDNHVDVTVDERYEILHEVMGKTHGVSCGAKSVRV